MKNRPAAAIALAFVCLASAAARAHAQDVQRGPTGAGPCTGTGQPTYHWDSVVTEPDTQPHLIPRQKLPKYPKSMFRDGYQGRLVLSFVVDATGRVAPSTVTVVGSSDAEYAQWGCRAAPQLRFTPARKDGRAVAALVSQPFSFSARIGRRAP